MRATGPAVDAADAADAAVNVEEEEKDADEGETGDGECEKENEEKKDEEEAGDCDAADAADDVDFADVADDGEVGVGKDDEDEDEDEEEEEDVEVSMNSSTLSNVQSLQNRFPHNTQVRFLSINAKTTPHASQNGVSSLFLLTSAHAGVELDSSDSIFPHSDPLFCATRYACSSSPDLPRMSASLAATFFVLTALNAAVCERVWPAPCGARSEVKQARHTGRSSPWTGSKLPSAERRRLKDTQDLQNTRLQAWQGSLSVSSPKLLLQRALLHFFAEALAWPRAAAGAGPLIISRIVLCTTTYSFSSLSSSMLLLLLLLSCLRTTTSRVFVAGDVGGGVYLSG